MEVKVGTSQVAQDMSLRDGLVDVRAVTGIEGAELTSKQASECDCAKTPEERER